MGLFLILGIILKKRKIFNGEILFPLHICLIQNTYITSIYRKYSFFLKTQLFWFEKKIKNGKKNQMFEPKANFLRRINCDTRMSFWCYYLWTTINLKANVKHNISNHM